MSIKLHVDEFALRQFIVSITLHVNSLLVNVLNSIYVLNDFSQSKQHFFFAYILLTFFAVSFHASYTYVIKLIIKLFTTILEL